MIKRLNQVQVMTKSQLKEKSAMLPLKHQVMKKKLQNKMLSQKVLVRTKSQQKATPKQKVQVMKVKKSSQNVAQNQKVQGMIIRQKDQVMKKKKHHLGATNLKVLGTIKRQQNGVPSQKVLEMVQNIMQNPKVLGTTQEMT